MANAYDEEFFLLCDFIHERLDVPVKLVQERVAALGLRAVRRILDDVGIRSTSDGIEWRNTLGLTNSLKYPLALDEEWIRYRLMAAWHLINYTIESIRHETEVRGL